MLDNQRDNAQIIKKKQQQKRAAVMPLLFFSILNVRFYEKYDLIVLNN